MAEAWQYWDITSAQVNSAGKSGMLPKNQSSLGNSAMNNSWAASFESIQPSAQQQMQGNASLEVDAANQKIGWYNQLSKTLSSLVTGNPSEEQKAANNAAVDAEYQAGETNIVPKMVAKAAGVDWATITGVLNETLGRVVIAVLAIVVIYLALRKMV